MLVEHPRNDPEAWKDILNEIEGRFANTRKKPFNLTATDPSRENSGQLVPWRMDNVQAAWTPQSRRYFQHIARLHTPWSRSWLA